MDSLNWLDIMIALVFMMFLLRGLSLGFISSTFEILGLVLGMLGASRYYALLAPYLGEIFYLAEIWADSLSFVALFLLVNALVLALGSLFSLLTSFAPLRFLDKVGGIITGGLVGAGVAGMILVLLTTFPLVDNFDERVEASSMGPSLRAFMEDLYGKSGELLPLDFPRLAFYPEELMDFSRERPPFRAINFEELEGSTCISCGGEVEFQGYLRTKENYISPKFICSLCRRTSDGCQTYEGYHEMYRGCPALLGRQGYRFDCGIWTNGYFVRPQGRCPLCGEGATHRSYRGEEKFILLP